MDNSTWLIRTKHFTELPQDKVKFTIHKRYNSRLKTFEDKTVTLSKDHGSIKEIEKYLGDIKELILPFYWEEFEITIQEYIKGGK